MSQSNHSESEIYLQNYCEHKQFLKSLKYREHKQTKNSL